MKNRQTLHWLVKNSKNYIFKISILSVSNIILALVGTGLALVSKLAIDAAQGASRAETTAEFVDFRNKIIVYGVLILLIVIGRFILRLYEQSLKIRVESGMEMDMRNRLFRQILYKRIQNISEYHSGELMNRITADTRIITDGITTIVPNLLYFITQFAGAAVVLIIFDWKFTLLFFAVGIVLSVVALLFRSKLNDLHKQVQQTDGKVRSFFQESIESLLVVKTFGVEEAFCEKGNALQEINYAVKMKRRVISILANAGFSFVFNAGYFFALIWCALKISVNAMTYGTLSAVVQLIGQVQTPFVNITKVVPQYYAILASAERIIEIESIEPEPHGGEVLDVERFYERLQEIRFEDIRFDYGREKVLTEGNATLKKGDFVAIRGISGIGKSTLMKMLLGVFEPSHGTIRLYQEDGNFRVASPDTRGLFAYVPQGNYLFSGSLRENILLLNPEATEEEIREVLQISDIYEFVKTLPQ